MIAIYEKLVARMNTNKTRHESKECVLKIKLLHPKPMSDPLNPLFHSQILAAHQFLLSKQLYFKSYTDMAKAEMKTCLTQFHQGLLWMTIFDQDRDSTLPAHAHMY